MGQIERNKQQSQRWGNHNKDASPQEKDEGEGG